MKKKSLFIKTFLNLIIFMLFMVALIHLSIFFIYRNNYMQTKEKELMSSLSYAENLLGERTRNEVDSSLQSLAEANHINIKLEIGADVHLYQGDPLFVDYEGKDDSTLYISGLRGTDAAMIRSADVVLKSGESAKLQMIMNLQSLQEARTIALSLLPYSLLISVVFSVLFAYFYSRKLTAPIRSISDAVHEMTKFRADARAGVQSEDEIGQLAEDINDLYESLLSTIENYQEKNDEVLHMEKERLAFFRSASHELKTPLAKLSVLTENMKYNVGKYKDHDQYLGESLTIINELSAMIREILEGVKTLPESDTAPASLSIRQYVEAGITDYQILAKSAHIPMTADLSGDFPVCMAAFDLQKVLSNILSNAVKYVTPNGSIRISLSDRELTVYNDALPISPERQATLWSGTYAPTASFAPQGGTQASESSGLGLFIVKTLLDKYNLSYRFIRQENGYAFIIQRPESAKATPI